MYILLYISTIHFRMNKHTNILTDLSMSLDEHLYSFQNIESQEMVKFQYEQKQILNDFHNYQNKILDKIQNIIYKSYLDALLEKNEKIQNIYLYKIKIKKAELKIISNFQKEQKLFFIKIQNTEIKALNLISQAITEAIAIIMINQDYTSEQHLNVYNIWNQAQNMPNVHDAKTKARTNILNAWNQGHYNIKNTMRKHITKYINKVKNIKNLLRFQIKDLDKDFNLVEIKNNNISLNKIKNAMVIFLIKIENVKNQTMYKVNKAREQAINDIQYKWDEYFASKKI